MPRTSSQIEYSQLASQYDMRWRRYCEATHSAVLDLCPATLNGACLDLGCGTGLLLERLSARYPATRLVGVDASHEMLTVARRKGIDGVGLVAGDVAALPFADGQFDLVVSSSVLHFAGDWKRAVADCARVVRPGGRVVIADWWDRRWGMRLLDLWLRCVNSAHRSPIPEADLIREFARRGLVSEQRTTCHAGGPWWLYVLSATKRVDPVMPSEDGITS